MSSTIVLQPFPSHPRRPVHRNLSDEMDSVKTNKVSHGNLFQTVVENKNTDSNLRKRKTISDDDEPCPASNTNSSPGLSKKLERLFHDPESVPESITPELAPENARYPLTNTYLKILHSCPDELFFNPFKELLADIDTLDGIVKNNFGSIKIHNKYSKAHKPNGNDLTQNHVVRLLLSPLKQLICTVKSIYPYAERGAESYNNLQYKAVHIINTPLIEREMSRVQGEPIMLNGDDHETKLQIAKQSVTNSITFMSKWLEDGASLASNSHDHTEFVNQFNPKIRAAFEILIDLLKKHLELIDMALSQEQPQIELSDTTISTLSPTPPTPEKLRVYIHAIHPSPARNQSPTEATRSIANFNQRVSELTNAVVQ